MSLFRAATKFATKPARRDLKCATFVWRSAGARFLFKRLPKSEPIYKPSVLPRVSARMASRKLRAARLRPLARFTTSTPPNPGWDTLRQPQTRASWVCWFRGRATGLGIRASIFRRGLPRQRIGSILCRLILQAAKARTAGARSKFTITGATTTSGSGYVYDLRYRFAYGTATYDAGVSALVTGTGFLNTEQIQPFFFTFGTPFTLALTIGAAVEVNNAFPGSASIDLSHTQTWGGLQGVSDGAGNTVPYTVTTSAGAVTYSQAIVPEPATALFVALGAATLTIRRRRK